MARKRAAVIGLGVGACLLAAAGGAAGYGLIGLPWDPVPGEKVAVSASTRGDKTVFDLTYGRRITRVLNITVIDGTTVWEVSGYDRPATVAYSEPPAGWKQMRPEDGRPPDVRGKRVTVRVKALIRVVLGEGVATTECEVVVPGG